MPGIEHPIIAAPMGPDLTGPDLVAAVSNAGGLGIVQAQLCRCTARGAPRHRGTGYSGQRGRCLCNRGAGCEVSSPACSLSRDHACCCGGLRCHGNNASTSAGAAPDGLAGAASVPLSESAPRSDSPPCCDSRRRSCAAAPPGATGARRGCSPVRSRRSRRSRE